MAPAGVFMKKKKNFDQKICSETCQPSFWMDFVTIIALTVAFFNSVSSYLSFYKRIWYSFFFALSYHGEFKQKKR